MREKRGLERENEGRREKRETEDVVVVFRLAVFLPLSPLL